MRAFLLTCAAVVGLSFPHAAPAAALPDGVTETSYRGPDGDRVLELAIDVPAPVADVWSAFSTTAGWTTWAAPVGNVDFRVGGAIESSYNPKAQIGDRNNIRNEILAIVPLRLFVIRNVQAPEKTPFDAPTFQKTLTAVTFTQVDATTTRVTVANAGYREGAPWDGVYQFFHDGNAYTLVALKQRFAKGPTDWAKALAPPPAKS